MSRLLDKQFPLDLQSEFSLSLACHEDPLVMAVNSVRFLYSATSPKLFELSSSEWTYLSDERFEGSGDETRATGMRGNRPELMGFLYVTPQRSVHPKQRSNDDHPPQSTAFIVPRQDENVA
jgi:hypothetical protein